METSLPSLKRKFTDHFTHLFLFVIGHATNVLYEPVDDHSSEHKPSAVMLGAMDHSKIHTTLTAIE